ncbi:hypothetical protein [Mesoplasma melaleucae]|uniref:Uncharacterized protein n=1 Tax=Mesoplasma melaleucae TaxID=81459 RepID=A0A2K8NYA6_9MOLU|nr:hypothetical protein [Mesoplasma melaleucae]ATZ17623.1 hypothetical protein EMELA_v1c00310 [Mesoplasma melaleucae]
MKVNLIFAPVDFKIFDVFDPLTVLSHFFVVALTSVKFFPFIYKSEAVVPAGNASLLASKNAWVLVA